MKHRKLLIAFLFLIMVLGIGSFTPSANVSAATSVTNVLRAPKAKSGYWVYTAKGKRYQFTKTGNYANKRWLKISGKVYYFTGSGYVKTGMKKYNGRYYYLDPSDGHLVTGWKTINSKKYYFWKSAYKGKLSGSAATGKVKISSKYYYFSKGGVRQSGWIKIGSYYYYFKKSDGSMAVSTVIDGYKIDASGKRGAKVTTTTTAKQVTVWVGDSRTVGLGTAMGLTSGKQYIAKVGEGLSWYKSTAEAKLKTILNKNATATVVFALGVNDISNYNGYITKYKTIMKAYPKANFYFLSVNPIDFSKYTSPWVTDKMIKKFNTELKNAFPTRYIDTYSLIKPYVTKGNSKYRAANTDAAGLHYTYGSSTKNDNLYKKIYDFVLSKI